MDLDILAEAQRLRAERRAFSLATVVAARQPTSGTPGAHAIILADGEVEGWIGGNCARPAVVKEGLAALADGSPRLVVLRPDGQAERTATPGVVEVPMLCASQGELQVFVEPFLPQIALVVIGSSPVARKLAELGALLDFAVWACDAEADMESFPNAERLVQSLDALRPQLSAHNYVVVATINAYDEDAVRAALASDASYVGLVASQRRLVSIQIALRAEGIADEQLDRLRRPKGLLGQTLRPGEIAFSVMAELIETRRQRVGFDLDVQPVAKASEREEAIDPICGMTVDVATAHYTSERGGQMYYFCCAGCKTRFEAPAS
ncbi:MAG: XdhC family protein [Ktedonobacterales bacterium]